MIFPNPISQTAVTSAKASERGLGMCGQSGSAYLFFATAFGFLLTLEVGSLKEIGFFCISYNYKLEGKDFIKSGPHACVCHTTCG